MSDKGFRKPDVCRFAALVFVGLFSSSAMASEKVVYQYDSQGRLIQVSASGSSVNADLVLAYQMDRAGNRTTLTVTNSKGSGQQVVVVPLNGLKLIPVNP